MTSASTPALTAASTCTADAVRAAVELGSVDLHDLAQARVDPGRGGDPAHDLREGPQRGVGLGSTLDRCTRRSSPMATAYGGPGTPGRAGRRVTAGVRPLATPRWPVTGWHHAETDEFSFLPAQAAAAGVDVPACRARRTDASGRPHAQRPALRGGISRVTLLHGAGLNAHTWDTTLLHLGVPALALDLPGHGDSSWREDAAYVGRVLAPDVVAALEAWTDGPQVLVGHSLGGLTAAALAASRPDLVDTVVIVDITPGIDPSGGPAQLRAFFAGPTDWATRDELVEKALAFGLGGARAAAERGVFLNTGCAPTAGSSGSTTSPTWPLPPPRPGRTRGRRMPCARCSRRRDGTTSPPCARRSCSSGRIAVSSAPTRRTSSSAVPRTRACGRPDGAQRAGGRPRGSRLTPPRDARGGLTPHGRAVTPRVTVGVARAG